MKKFLILGLIMLLLVSGCKSSGFIKTDSATIQQKFENDETFILYLGLSYCSACKIFRSIIETSIKQEGFDVFYLEFDKVPTDDKEVLENLIKTYLEQNEEFPYAFPILFVVKESKIIDQFSLQQVDNEFEFIDRINKSNVFSE